MTQNYSDFRNIIIVAFRNERIRKERREDMKRFYDLGVILGEIVDEMSGKTEPGFIGRFDEANREFDMLSRKLRMTYSEASGTWDYASRVNA